MLSAIATLCVLRAHWAQQPKHEAALEFWRISLPIDKPAMRTRATWKKYGDRSREIKLGLDFKDRSFLDIEKEIALRFDSRRQDPRLIQSFADAYKAKKSRTTLLKLAIAYSRFENGSSESPSSYRVGTGDLDLGLNVFIEFLDSLDERLTVIDSRLLVQLDSVFFNDVESEWRVVSELDKLNILDRHTALAFATTVASSCLVSKTFPAQLNWTFAYVSKLHSEKQTFRTLMSKGFLLQCVALRDNDEVKYREAIKLLTKSKEQLELGSAYDKARAITARTDLKRLQRYADTHWKH